eukprot:16437114-Heterocapsa_arctica.AAC.1
MRKTAARKVREAAADYWKPPPRPPPTPPKGKGKEGKGGKKGAKGQDKGKLRTDDAGNELCFSFNNKSGDCAAGLPGGHCLAGRVHKCTKCGDARHASADGASAGEPPAAPIQPPPVGRPPAPTVCPVGASRKRHGPGAGAGVVAGEAPRAARRR